MAIRISPRCVHQNCERVAKRHSLTLCEVHWHELTTPKQERWKYRPAQPTKLPEWEWIKKELYL